MMKKHISILALALALAGCTGIREWSGQALGRAADKISSNEPGSQYLIGTVSKVAWVVEQAGEDTLLIGLIGEDGLDYLVICADHLWVDCRSKEKAARGKRVKFNGKPETTGEPQRFAATYLEEK